MDSERRSLTSFLSAYCLLPTAYFVAALIGTWPLVLHLGDAVISGIDPWMMTWNFWEVAERLGRGQGPFHTDLLFYPVGADLYLHTLFPAVTVPFAPITWTFGPLVAHNLADLLAFTLTGYTMYLFCRDLGARSLGAFLAGFGFDFCAWHQARLHGHTNLAALYWMPLYLLFLFRLGRPLAGTGGRRFAPVGGAALTLALSALCDYQQAVYLALVTALWLVSRPAGSGPWAAGRDVPEGPSGGGSRAAGDLPQDVTRNPGQIPVPQPDPTSKRTTQNPKFLSRLGRVAAAWGLAGILLAPVLGGTLRSGASGDFAVPEFAQAVTFSADLLAYVVPYQYNPFVGGLVTPLVNTLWGKLDTERALYLTVTLLGLGGWGLVHTWPRGRVWLNVILVAGLLSLGPALHIGGQASIPLPGLLLYLLPGAGNLRAPGRFGLLVALALAVLAAFALTALEERLAARAPTPALARRNRAILGGAVLLALVLEEAAIPHPLTPAEVPGFYRQIAAPVGSPPALVEVPIRGEGVYQLYQAVHGHPLVGGYLARERISPLLEGAPLLRDLKYLDAGDIIRQDPAQAGPVVLAANGIGYIVVHKDPPLTVAGYLPWTAAEQAQARALAAAAGTPVYDDAHLTAYAARPPAAAAPPVLSFGAGWTPVTTPPAGGRGRWATAGAGLILDTGRPVTVTLSLTLRAYPAARSVILRRAGTDLAAWPATADPATFHSPPLMLAPGQTTITLESDTPSGLLPSLTPLDGARTPAILFAAELRLD